MSKTSRLRLRNERRRKIWCIARELAPRVAQYLHGDGWSTYKGYLIWFNGRREATTALTELVLKDPSLIGKVWVQNRLTMRRP